jgi:hypothetical protein
LPKGAFGLSRQRWGETAVKSHFLVASVAVFAVALASAPAVASDKTDVMAVVNKAVADFNKADLKAWAADCGDQPFIIDDIAPYHWDGAGACSDWWRDYEADAKKNGITDGAVKIAAVRHVDITADHAYVVLTANFGFKQNGKPGAQNGSSFALVLNKAAAGWHISGWSWAPK